MICRVVGKMLSDKELRRNGNYWAMKAKAWLTETREDHPEDSVDELGAKRSYSVEQFQ